MRFVGALTRQHDYSREGFRCKCQIAGSIPPFCGEKQKQPKYSLRILTGGPSCATLILIEETVEAKIKPEGAPPESGEAGNPRKARRQMDRRGKGERKRALRRVSQYPDRGPALRAEGVLASSREGTGDGSPKVVPWVCARRLVLGGGLFSSFAPRFPKAGPGKEAVFQGAG